MSILTIGAAAAAVVARQPPPPPPPSPSSSHEKVAAPAERRLADLPDKLGLAGPIAGISNGALLVGGGTNFPDGMPWEGGKKVWHDELYVLESPNGQWKSGFKLPRSVAYAATVTTDRGVIYLGGNDG